MALASDLHDHPCAHSRLLLRASRRHSIQTLRCEQCLPAAAEGTPEAYGPTVATHRVVEVVVANNTLDFFTLLSHKALPFLYCFRVLRPALITSSTRRSCDAMMGAELRIWRLTMTLSQMPSSSGSRGSPVAVLKPTVEPLSTSSWRAMIESWASKPAFSASVLGTARSASASAWTPSLARPCTVFFTVLTRWRSHATSKAPAPGTTPASLRVLVTARRPSRAASLICAMVWSFGPLMRMVHPLGFLGSSTKVYFSSPRTCSYTLPAYPSTSGASSSSELTATPPQLIMRRSMLRFLARRRAMMPSLARRSSESGSMPFWLMMTKLLSVPSHICFLSAITWRTRSSVNSRSAETSFSRCSAEL
mmetsp:Transcript_25158/g.82537  ORF Transcript_25158/g.82537 Transcript_25158/m.82537 type:complete len:363 (+) Transcript_25158:131-1219(+)